MNLDPTAVLDGTVPIVRRRRFSNRIAVSTAFLAGTGMSAMDVHIVNVALPSISRQFHEPLASVQWIALGYAVSLAVVMPVSGWVGDRLGTKRTFLFALAMFSAASALCGLSKDLAELIVFRVVQGLGGGMLVPVGVAMLYRAYPPQERVRVSRRLLPVNMLSPALAPIVGGVLVTNLSWRWVFYVNIPVSLAAFIFCAAFLDEHREGAPGRFDAAGFALSGVGMGLVLYGVSEGSLTTWTSSRVLLSGALGLIALVAFVVLELRKKYPMLRLRLLQDRMFRATNIVSTLNYQAFYGVIFLVPVFVQEVRGQSALNSGLTTFPQAIGIMVASQPLGRLYGRIGPRIMMSLGGLGFVIPLVFLAFIGPHTSLWDVRGLMFVAGFFNAAFMISTSAAMFTTIGHGDTGHASAISNSQRQISLAIGVAFLSTIVTSIHGSRYLAFHAAFLSAAGIALLASIFSAVLIHTKDAASTMVPHRSRRATPT